VSPVDRDALVAKAAALVGEFELTKPSITAGGIGAALETASGMVYTGINLDLACGIGFCAEHSAVAEMLKSRETVVRRIVAVNEERIIAPCGRCREMLVQVDARNLDCEVLLPDGAAATLRELLPSAWLEQYIARKRG
jgi:cytidine deaminase